MIESILERIALGEPQAVQECIERYKGLVWSLVRRQLSGPEAEDAAQEIFIELWKSADRFDPSRASEPAFVAMIARRRLIDRIRRSGRRPRTEPLELTPESAAASGSSPVEAVAEAALAGRVLAELSAEEREALLLSVCHGYSHSEIAERTGMPLGTVKTYIRRGLARVRDRLADQGATAGTQS